jgi:hypothetical protein
LNIDNRPQRRAADLADALGQDAVERLGDVANGGLGQIGQDVERGGRLGARFELTNLGRHARASLKELFWGIPFQFDGRRRSIKPMSSVVGSVCNPIVGVARSTDR